MEIKYSSGNLITTTHTNKNVLKKKRTSRSFFVIILLGIAIVLISLFSPFFNITDIEIEGIEKVAEQVVADASGVEKGMNIFRADLVAAKENISEIPYIDSVKIKRVLPNKVKAVVIERKPVGSIPFMGSYIIIDRNGNVLEVVSQLEDTGFPVVSGLKFSEFKLGRMIRVDEENKLDTVVSCVKELINNNLLDKVKLIDVHDIDNIQLNIEDRVVVNVGDVFRMRHKMEFLRAILNEIKPGQKGLIDLSVEKPVLSLEN